jgi:hypothetical protein
MITRFFTFPDMETSFQLAFEAGLTKPDESGEQRLVAFTHDYALDVVGTIYRPTGETTTVDGLTVPVMAPIPGWHVNVRVLSGDPVPASFLPFEVFPATPERDFA